MADEASVKVILVEETTATTTAPAPLATAPPAPPQPPTGPPAYPPPARQPAQFPQSMTSTAVVPVTIVGPLPLPVTGELGGRAPPPAAATEEKENEPAPGMGAALGRAFMSVFGGYFGTLMETLNVFRQAYHAFAEAVKPPREATSATTAAAASGVGAATATRAAMPEMAMPSRMMVETMQVIAQTVNIADFSNLPGRGSFAPGGGGLKLPAPPGQQALPPPGGQLAIAGPAEAAPAVEGMAGAASKASAALVPVAVAAAAVAVTAYVLKKSFDGLSTAADRYAQYSAVAAQAQAQAETRAIQADIRRGRESGPALAEFITARAELQQRYEDAKMKFLQGMQPLITSLLSIASTIMEGVGSLLEVANQMPGGLQTLITIMSPLLGALKFIGDLLKKAPSEAGVSPAQTFFTGGPMVPEF